MLGSLWWAELNEMSDHATTFLIVNNILLERWDSCIIVAILTLTFIGNHADDSWRRYRTCKQRVVVAHMYVATATGYG